MGTNHPAGTDDGPSCPHVLATGSKTSHGHSLRCTSTLKEDEVERLSLPCMVSPQMDILMVSLTKSNPSTILVM